MRKQVYCGIILTLVGSIQKLSDKGYLDTSNSQSHRVNVTITQDFATRMKSEIKKIKTFDFPIMLSYYHMIKEEEYHSETENIFGTCFSLYAH